MVVAPAIGATYGATTPVLHLLSSSSRSEFESTNLKLTNSFLPLSKRASRFTKSSNSYLFPRKAFLVVRAASDPPANENQPNSGAKPASPFTPGKLAANVEASPFSAGKFGNIPKVETETKVEKAPDAPSPPAVSQTATAPSPTPAPPTTAPKSPFATPTSPFQVKPTGSPPNAPTSGSVRPSPSFGSSNKRIIQALQADQKGSPKVSAPSNIFDEPRRTAEEIEAEKWRFSIDRNQILLLLSFFASSMLMFLTVYVVWKLGAIHFNDDI